MSDYHNTILFRDPMVALEFIKITPPCVTKYRGVVLNSGDEKFSHYKIMVTGLAFIPERIVRMIGAMWIGSYQDEEIMLVHLHLDHEDEESAQTVLEALSAACEVYGHPKILICSTKGPIFSATAPASTGEAMSFSIASAINPQTELAQ